MADFHMNTEPEAEMIPRDEASAPDIEVRPGRTHVLGGVKNTVRMLVGIRSPEVVIDECSEMASRPPLNVACVLDRSGSMQGEPLEYAKRAASKLIKHLREEDKFHFIAYSTTPEEIFRNGDLSETGKEVLKSKVASIQSQGQTNLFGGLEAAVDLLCSQETHSSTAQGQHEVRRIFLFSDGCVNRGVTDRQQILNKVAEWAQMGITVNSFGIGTHFDEPLMRGIAESGKGRYTYLAKSQDIPKLVSKSIHGLLDLFASESTLDVRGLAHTTVVRVYGADDENDDAAGTDATPGLLVLGDLHHGSERRVLVELEVSPPGGSAEGIEFEAAEWTISFQRQNSLSQFSGKVGLKVTNTRSALGEESTAVRAAFAIQKAADLDLEVSQHLAHNDRVRAKDAKARQLSLLKETLAALQNCGGAPNDIDTLERVLERAERVSAQMESGENNELVRRQCIQEMELNRCMSDADWLSGCDSDEDAPDNRLMEVDSPTPSGRLAGSTSPLGRLAGWQSPPLARFADTPSLSPVSSRGSSPRNSVPGSPRSFQGSRSRSPPGSPQIVGASNGSVEDILNQISTEVDPSPPLDHPSAEEQRKQNSGCVLA